jgi:hypothetical protein
MPGVVTDVDVILNTADMLSPSIWNYLLVAPDGTTVALMTEAGTYAAGTYKFNVVFDQSRPTALPAKGSAPLGTSDGQTVFYRPTSYAANASARFPGFPAIIDVTANLDRLNGHAPNGTWKLYVTGEFSGGGNTSFSIASWSLQLNSAVPKDTSAPVFSKTSILGRTVGFDLSEASSLQYRISRLSNGVKVKSKCLAPKKGRKGKKCTRATLLPGAITRIGTAGVNTFTFNGKLNKKRLAPGRYRITATATDAAGNLSAPTSWDFKIKKPKKN